MTGQVELKEISKDSCFTLLHFIYTRKLDPCKINLQLLQHAVKYQVQDLQQYCSPFLISQIDSDNCIDTLVLADQVSDLNLKEAAKKFILENKVEVGKLKEKASKDLLAEMFAECLSLYQQ